MQKTDLYCFIDGQKAMLTGISDRIWEYAETAFQEYRSSELLCTTLEQAGFTVQRGVANIDSAFRASFGSGKPYTCPIPKGVKPRAISNL